MFPESVMEAEDPNKDQVIPILVVDDRAEKRLAISSLLADRPCKVVEADSGEGGLREILKADFALVILDVYMPGMDGFELARLIRERPKTKYLPIIFHSAEEPSRDQIARAYGLGVVDYLVQPVLPEIFRAKVQVFADLFVKGKLLERQKEEVEQLREAQMQAKLLQTQAALDKAELRLAEARRMESLGKLAGGIAHEFNNILTGIMGMAHLVRESMREPTPMRENMDLIIAGSEKAAKLTSEVLSYARKQRLVPEALDLNKLGPKWIEEFAARDAKAVLQWRPASTPAIVLIDEGRLSEAVGHLLHNAMEAGATRVALTVALEADAEGGKAGEERVVVLEVADNGKGMEPEVLAKCLEPFFTTKGPNAGAGMGLSMVHGFVKQSGGVLSLASRPGEGTKVQLRFARAS